MLQYLQALETRLIIAKTQRDERTKKTQKRFQIMAGNIITSFVKEGIYGSKRPARRYTSPQDVFMTMEQAGRSSL